MSAQQMQYSKYGFGKTVELPYKMLSTVGGNDTTLDAIATEVNEKLKRVVAQL